MTTDLSASTLPSKDVKHSVLMNALRKVQDVVDHLDELNHKLGVYKQNIAAPAATAAAIPSPEAPKKPEPDTLVAVLDHLPDSIQCKVDKLHSMLNDLENSLI